MSDAAAIAAELVDVRNVGMHKCIKLTLHVPAERAPQVMAAFGWPTATDPVPVALARLNVQPAKEATPSDVEQPPVPAADPNHSPGRPKMKWDEMSCAQQAGILCADTDFQRYLKVTDEQQAASRVRNRCGVRSRSEIDEYSDPQHHWHDLVASFRLWQAGRPF